MCTFENFRSSEKESASSVLTSMRVCPHTCDSFLVQGSFHYGGISLTNHTEILCKQYENALFNHGNALLYYQRNHDSKEESYGGGEQFHCGGGGGKLSSKTHSWPPGLREAGRRYSDLRPVFTRSTDFNSEKSYSKNNYPLIIQRKWP